MDAIDRKILSALQADGRLTITELAECVGLSLSPCHRRVKALEESGAISGYRAQLNPAMLGLHFSAIVFAVMKDGNRESVARFEEALAEIPQVINAKRLFGDPDYILNIVTEDLPAFQKLYDEKLSALPGVQRLISTIIMKEVVSDRLLPL